MCVTHNPVVERSLKGLCLLVARPLTSLKVLRTPSEIIKIIEAYVAVLILRYALPA